MGRRGGNEGMVGGCRVGLGKGERGGGGGRVGERVGGK